jgi:hypothetical protein
VAEACGWTLEIVKLPPRRLVAGNVEPVPRPPQSPLMLGPPGAGKSMLAWRLTTIVPTMSLAEALETTRIHRVAGRTGDRTTLVTTRPCRAPHYLECGADRRGPRADAE